MLCALCGALLLDAEIEKYEDLCFDCVDEMEEEELKKWHLEKEKKVSHLKTTEKD